ncbi:hypothetical protein EYF80_032749 [Liparis tanakae]|uniref:Uncharacterized protein n=1 Tax=Liparis tanakae TaxID=230148 RepID=A0A4Z2GTV3_9TELE|nr:hypothetical protein EYF80_032749 [Liparis tanakae]
MTPQITPGCGEEQAEIRSLETLPGDDETYGYMARWPPQAEEHLKTTRAYICHPTNGFLCDKSLSSRNTGASTLPGLTREEQWVVRWNNRRRTDKGQEGAVSGIFEQKLFGGMLGTVPEQGADDVPESKRQTLSS